MNSISSTPQRLLVTGATGFIGPKLVRHLLARGDSVLAYVRDEKKARALLGANVGIATDLEALPRSTRVDGIVNLAGASIAGSLWTTKRRALLLDSRLGVTARLLAFAARLERKPRVWLNASAIGYYGARAGDEPLDEQAGVGNGFQAELCRRWEEAAARAADYGIAASMLRFGVVLGREGGALPAFARPVRLFAGAVLGSGQQWISWIHIDDLLELLTFVLERETLAGPINATAPEPVRHADFMKEIAATLRRPLWPLRVPAPVLRLALGELAELFVDGQRVLPRRALEIGFRFRYATAKSALQNLLGDAAVRR